MFVWIVYPNNRGYANGLTGCKCKNKKKCRNTGYLMYIMVYIEPGKNACEYSR